MSRKAPQIRQVSSELGFIYTVNGVKNHYSVAHIPTLRVGDSVAVLQDAMGNLFVGSMELPTDINTDQIRLDYFKCNRIAKNAFGFRTDAVPLSSKAGAESGYHR